MSTIDIANMSAEDKSALVAALLGGDDKHVADVTDDGAATEAKMRKIKIPTYEIKTDLGGTVKFAQVYATKGSETIDSRAYVSHGGFRVDVNPVSKEGKSGDGQRPVRLTADVVRAIRSLTKAQAEALLTDARSSVEA